MNKPTRRKVGFIGGGGVRTPLVIFGVNEVAEANGTEEFVIYDPDAERARIMVELGRAVIEKEGGSLKLRATTSIDDAVDGAAFVMNSIRVGGIAARASDEATAILNGYPGQETTGPGGVAMALRTVRIAIEQARVVEKRSPNAWLINFTNPAGLITQAIRHNTGAKVVGICDTPTELLHRIQIALGASADEVQCDYVGLNHLGWVRRIVLRGHDVTDQLLADDNFLSQLYTSPLFDHDLIRSLRLIPTEYLFFYYSRRRAFANQVKVGATRGAEIEELNNKLFVALREYLSAGRGQVAVQTYVQYLNRRSASYMKLESIGGSALNDEPILQVDPFRAVSGYHRIALDVMNALTGVKPGQIIVNTRNGQTLDEIEPDDIVEAISMIQEDSIEPIHCGSLPEEVRGLVLGVKAYERAIIDAAVHDSYLSARRAMLIYPAIGEWEPSAELLRQSIK